MTPHLVVKTFHGSLHYSIEHNGPSQQPSVGSVVERIPLTSDQANCSLETLKALHRDGMLK